ncbi:hypothetical protein [Streptomyces zagrosensis]|uniref:Secreted protein n=1 Tax=Streptomyces zagrosensis TaxID=1042984 RepID=A0A7W9QDW6_9ACTN|nr:hypothetical protein [Streptomyces zagrosensis]MBB5938435.1 hypothetical protein [Streptomyces zagrosensis]
MKCIPGASAVLALVCSAVTLIAPSASAQTLVASTCQFGNDTGRIVASAYIYRNDAPELGSVGRIAVCRDDAHNYWGYVGFAEKLTASQWAQATLYRQRDGSTTTSINCDSSGGNGKVMPNQRVCWTPKFTGLSGRYTFLAKGEMYSSHTGNRLALETTGEFTR